MTLRIKSLLITLVMVMLMVFLVGVVINKIIITRFQMIENEKVETDIKRMTYVYQDKLKQIGAKLADWAIWDDTYEFMTDGNKEYKESNLVPESFGKIGIDEALFINQSGELVDSLYAGSKTRDESDFPDDLYQYFKAGSSLLDVDDKVDYDGGLLNTEEGLILYQIAKVYKSNGDGPTNGWVVFGKYFDDAVVESIKEMTQNEVLILNWKNPGIPADFALVTSNYALGQKESISILNDNLISGYLVIEDVFGKPQAILRTDIKRDITIQGAETIRYLGLGMIMVGLMVGLVSYLMLNGMVLKKVLAIASEVDTLGKSEVKGRLVITKGNDEVDRLRGEINGMLDSLAVEKQKGESLIDLINTIVLMLDANGRVKLINKKGLEILGYQKEEVIGKEWFENFVPLQAKIDVTPRFKKIISGNIADNSQIENEILTKDKKTILISWHTNIIKDSNEKVAFTVSIGEDITLKNKEEKKREEYASELEKLNKLMVDRELKMVNLKEKLDKLENIKK